MIRADIDARRATHKEHGLPPSGHQRAEVFPTSLRAATVEVEGKTFNQLEGDASIVDRGYEMWDFYGPYIETVREGAFAKTLDANPDVAFLVNHGGVTMARTTAGTLELSTNPHLHVNALLNPKRSDVKDLVIAVEEGSIDQMSFAFRITGGSWSPDYTEYYIEEVDLHRGDVSAVNYGANPYTTIAARAKQMFEAIDSLEGPALRAAQERLAARLAAREAEPVAQDPGTPRRLLEARLEAGLI